MMGAPRGKILICDDSMLARKKLTRSIEMYGEYTIIEAVDGQQAVDLFKQEKPDLVFMDIVMPGLNGMDALKAIKAYDRNAKVVMASSAGTQALVKEAIDAGAADFIQKPWEDSLVGQILERVI